MNAFKTVPPDLHLIESEHEFFAKSGPLPASFNDVRQFPRFYHRASIEARVHAVRPGSTAVECRVLTRDLSRGGMNLLHSEQLFPGQWIDVALCDGSQRRVEVQWCRRLDERCYAAGCKFIKVEEDAETSTETSGAASG
jgi:hypothetical protein